MGENTAQLARNDGIMKGDPAIQSDSSLVTMDPAVQQESRYLDVKQQPAPGFLKPGRNVPASIDPAAASKPLPFPFTLLRFMQDIP